MDGELRGADQLDDLGEPDLPRIEAFERYTRLEPQIEQATDDGAQ
jgi:hypothetical protein